MPKISAAGRAGTISRPNTGRPVFSLFGPSRTRRRDRPRTTLCRARRRVMGWRELASRAHTAAGRALQQSIAPLSVESFLGLGLENRVPLLTGLDNLPNALETRGYDEGIAGAELVFLAADRLYANAAFDDHAEFVFRVTHAPFAGGAGPDAAEELLSRLGILIRCARPRNSG